ncbi:hypothetical protein ACETIH_21975 [Microvirga arabica]|uniref:SGNH/GDSL hydrolase family protein n=1 Tax=Microvirga arabica TaxID=1128671 RepID=A0ABV6YDG5_9HYPH
MAWRQFDGEPFASRLGQRQILNGASGFLKIHQTRFLTTFYMEHFAHLKTIILMLGPPDFENCTSEPAELFNLDDAGGYAFGHDLAGPLYLRYFAPVFYLRRVRNHEGRWAPLTGDLWMDKYGSGPMQWTSNMMDGLRYGALRYDSACTDALLAMLSEIKAKGVRPVVVFPPVHPEYRQRHPETIPRMKQIAERIGEQVREGVDFFDMSESGFGSSDFYDAVHLQWPAVQRFSQKLAELVLSRSAAGTPSDTTRLTADAAIIPATITSQTEP